MRGESPRGLDTDLYGETNEKDSRGPHSLWPTRRFRVNSWEVGKPDMFVLKPTCPGTALIGTLDPGRFGICTRTGLCPARSGNNATQIAEMAVKQQPPDMSELLRSWADNGIHPLALRLNGCACVSKLNEPLLPVLR